MGERRTSMIERVVQRVEEHIEEWRRRDAARHAEADANRDQLWAAAAERERMLAEVIGEGEARRASAEEVMEEHRLVFVVHSEEVAQTLETFAEEGDRLIRVIPSTRGPTPRRWASRDPGSSSKSRSSRDTAAEA